MISWIRISIESFGNIMIKVRLLTLYLYSSIKLRDLTRRGLSSKLLVCTCLAIVELYEILIWTSMLVRFDFAMKIVKENISKFINNWFRKRPLQFSLTKDCDTFE